MRTLEVVPAPYNNLHFCYCAKHTDMEVFCSVLPCLCDWMCAAMQLTRVGSRRVIQVGACIAIIISVIGLLSCTSMSHAMAPYYPSVLVPCRFLQDLSC